MEAELTEAFPGSTVEIVGGKGGIFDVTVGDTLVYHKDKEVCDRFPEAGEVPRLVREMT